jgi:hypothetical protein
LCLFIIIAIIPLFNSAMLDQNLLDKQYILESLVDMLEKHSTTITNGASGGVSGGGPLNPVASQATNSQSQRSNQQSSSTANAATLSTSTQLALAIGSQLEASSIKLILTTSWSFFYG